MPESNWNSLTPEEKRVLKEILAWAIMAAEKNFLYQPHHSLSQENYINQMRSAAAKLNIEPEHYQDDR